MEETDPELQNDNILIQIRDKLLKDGVKLWLEPYYSQNESCEQELRVRNV